MDQIKISEINPCYVLVKPNKGQAIISSKSRVFQYLETLDPGNHCDFVYIVCKINKEEQAIKVVKKNLFYSWV